MMGNAIIFILMIFLGCSDVGEQYSAPPDIPISQLLAAPETTMVSGRTVYLTTSLYRDFMPVTPPDGDPLGGIIYITAIDTFALNNLISSDALWVIYNKEIWKGWLKDNHGWNRKNQLVKFFSGGPKWGPRVFVDVVVRLYDTHGNKYFLRASKQNIGSTS